MTNADRNKEQDAEQNMALWIVSYTTIGRSPKVRKLARALGKSLPETIGMIHLLWGSVLEQREDGDITDWGSEDVAEFAHWKGIPGKLYEALQDNEHRFIDERYGRKLIHDWLDYAGRYLRRKYETKNKQMLIDIWKKHGRSYGQRDEEDGGKKKEPDVVLTEPMEMVVKRWNEFAKTTGLSDGLRLSEVLKLSSGRKRHLKKRLEEERFEIVKIIEEIKQSQFLLGHNKQKWNISLDWIIESETNYLKVLEGKYRDKKDSHGADSSKYDRR